MFSCSVFLRTCSARVEHSYFGPFEARKLCKVTAISACMYNSPIGMTSITLHTRTKFMNCSAEHGKERCRWQHAMLSSALSHTTLQCGTATATTIVAAHHAPPIAACDQQPTMMQCCSSAPREPTPAASSSTPSGSDAGQAAACSGKTAATLERPAIAFSALHARPHLLEHRGAARRSHWNGCTCSKTLLERLGQNAHF